MGIFKPNFRDTRPHNEGDMEYFKKMLKGTGYPDPPPPTALSTGPFYLVTCLKGKKILEVLFPWKKRERVSFISPFWFVKLPFCLERLLQSFWGGRGVWKFAF